MKMDLMIKMVSFTKEVRINLWFLIGIFLMLSCSLESKNELELIEDRVRDCRKSGQDFEIVLSNDLLLVNGGEPPKYFKKYGLNINSTLEKDIVLIQFLETDTLGMKIKMNNFFRNYSIHCNDYSYSKGDRLIVKYVDRQNIVLEKRSSDHAN